MHSDTPSCSCGQHHIHEEDCGCGHSHEHGGHCSSGHIHPVQGLSEDQADALAAIYQRGYLPVARFSLRSSKNDEAFAVAMEPVYIADPAEEQSSVRENGSLFSSLEEAGLITLDYDMPLKGYPYREYLESHLYAGFLKAVREAGERPEFVFDTPCLELGSMALTEEGREAARSMLG